MVAYRSNFRGDYFTREAMNMLRANPTGDVRIFQDGEILPVPMEVARFKNGKVMSLKY